MTPKPDLTFEPPGPGTWTLDNQHFPKPLSSFDGNSTAKLIGEIISEGAERYGMLDELTCTVVSGFVYLRRGTVGTPPGSSDAPSLDHPDVKDRTKRSVRVMKSELWRDDLREFHDVVKPDSIKRNRGLASVDVTSLTDDQLLKHVEECRDNCDLMTQRHHLFTRCAGLPVGLFLAKVVDWTGADPIDIAPVVSGASPISAGITPQLEALVKAIQNDESARALLQSEEPAMAKLAKLREMDGDVGNTAEEYALIDGHRLATGFDVTDIYALELPEALVGRISTLVESGIEPSGPRHPDVVKKIRDLVPDEHKEAFDIGLDQAREHLEVKDERGLYQDVWAKGITRKALLEAGDRLHARGILSDPDHVFDIEWPDFHAAWRGENVDNEELARRREYRKTVTWRDAPPFLGPPPEPSAEPVGLPPELLTLMRGMSITGQLMGRGPAPEVEPVELTGTVASQGTYEGIARVAIGDYDFERIAAGDVLVTSTHSEAYNTVSSRVGAIVTDTGGVLSHLSVIAREMGIPSVTACNNATVAIKDGDRIPVDAENGIVTVLESAG